MDTLMSGPPGHVQTTLHSITKKQVRCISTPGLPLATMVLTAVIFHSPGPSKWYSSRLR